MGPPLLERALELGLLDRHRVERIHRDVAEHGGAVPGDLVRRPAMALCEHCEQVGGQRRRRREPDTRSEAALHFPGDGFAQAHDIARVHLAAEDIGVVLRLERDVLVLVVRHELRKAGQHAPRLVVPVEDLRRIADHDRLKRSHAALDIRVDSKRNSARFEVGLERHQQPAPAHHCSDAAQHRVKAVKESSSFSFSPVMHVCAKGHWVSWRSVRRGGARNRRPIWKSGEPRWLKHST